jgi:hypothetical protein
MCFLLRGVSANDITCDLVVGTLGSCPSLSVGRRKKRNQLASAKIFIIAEGVIRIKIGT